MAFFIAILLKILNILQPLYRITVDRLTLCWRNIEYGSNYSIPVCILTFVERYPE